MPELAEIYQMSELINSCNKRKQSDEKQASSSSSSPTHYYTKVVVSAVTKASGKNPDIVIPSHWSNFILSSKSRGKELHLYIQPHVQLSKDEDTKEETKKKRNNQKRNVAQPDQQQEQSKSSPAKQTPKRKSKQEKVAQEETEEEKINKITVLCRSGMVVVCCSLL